MPRVQGGSLGDEIDFLLRGRSDIVFHFQPIVALEQAAVVGYEALVRFPASMGPAPDVVFAAAGEIGRQVQLEAFVTRRALSARRLLPPNCFLSINVSPTFLFSPQWDSTISEAPDLSAIVVEITEQNAVRDYAAMREKAERIRACGGHIAVDDTGSGYASLKHVMELRPQFIKLDRFFVDGCHTGGVKPVMIEMIGQAADRLDAWLIAEGIELEAELAELTRLRVPLAQGYFLGRPSPEMKPLSAEARFHLRNRGVSLAPGSTILGEMEHCALATGPRHAEEMLAADPSLGCAAVLDAFGRPILLVERSCENGFRALPQPLRVQAASTPEDLVHRALVRPAGSRFDPMVVVDELGGLQGVVRMERLIKAALGKETGA